MSEKPRLGARVRALATAALAAVSLLVGAAAMEAGLRLYLYLESPERFQPRFALPSFYGVYDRSLWLFDAQLGYTYRTDRTVALTTINDGAVAGCQVIDYVNADGNIGPPLDTHEDPDFTIAIFGDSWTAFYQDGVTWPHLLRERLEAGTGKKINLHNFGRDGVGLIHMFRLAARKLPEIQPDLALFAFITDDLDRAMFWRTETWIDGELRALTSLDPTPRPSLARAADTMPLFPKATHDWCRRTKGGRGQIVKEIEDKMRRLLLQARSAEGAAPSLTTLSHSYLYNQVVYGDATRFARAPQRTSQNPRLSETSFADVQEFPETVRRVLEIGTPIELAHLAIYPELEQGREYLATDRQASLLQSLEALTRRETLRTTDHIAIPQEDLAAINVSETDYHPSRRGMAFYAEAVAAMMLSRPAVRAHLLDRP